MTKGFTIVELMVTLGIAGIFLLSGFQLYQVVQLRNAEAREMSEASNVAYGVLRKEAQNYDGTWVYICGNIEPYPKTLSPTPTTALPQPVKVKINHCIPNNDTGAWVVRTTVTVEYGQKGDSVVHATYVPYKRHK